VGRERGGALGGQGVDLLLLDFIVGELLLVLLPVPALMLAPRDVVIGVMRRAGPSPTASRRM